MPFKERNKNDLEFEDTESADCTENMDRVRPAFDNRSMESG